LGHRRLHHDGALPGFKSDLERYPDDALTVIVLTNSGNANAEYIAQHVAGFYVPALTPVLEPTIPEGSPSYTARVKEMINGFITGNLDMTMFGTAAAARINEDSKARLKQALTTYGKIQTISLVERKAVGQNQRVRYRLDYQMDSFFLVCVFDQSGKIVGFGVGQ
jgi:D-alanyl-D-alanine carboxypeptidase